MSKASDDDAVLEVVPDRVAGVAEDAEHAPVLRQHLGDEAVDAVLAGGGGEVLEQHRAEPAALVGVGDDEGDLGRRPVRVDPVVAADGDDVVADRRDERHPVDVVDGA